jgi:hypothetical protein
VTKLLTILLALLGAATGIGAGLALKPAPAPVAAPCPEPDAKAETTPGAADWDSDAKSGEREYVKLNNQFVVPVVAGKRVDSLVALSLSVEIDQGQSAALYSREPKLRDAFLQVLFDHANMGGFDGAFTRAGNMEILRNDLTDVARSIVGEAVRGVLITNIARQDS